jgi:hypothetical protein
MTTVVTATATTENTVTVVDSCDGPAFASAEIGLQSLVWVVITFSGSLDTGDFPNNAYDGMTVYINGSPVTIDAGWVWEGVVRLSLDEPPIYGDTVTVSYNSANGHLAGTGVAVPSFVSQSVTNNIGAINHTYYVSKDTGNDGWAGTLANPWATIQHAVDMAVAGDLIYIRESATPYNEKVLLFYGNGGGSSGHFVTYINYPGESPIIDGTGIDLSGTSDALFRIQVTHYVRVSGIQVQMSECSGICPAYSHNIHIDHCYTYNTGNSGIYTPGCDYIVVDGNEVELACNPLIGTGTDECLKMSMNDYSDVKYNDVHDPGWHEGGAGGEGLNMCDYSNYGICHHNYVHDMGNRLCISSEAWGVGGGGVPITHIDIFQNIACRGGYGFTMGSEYTGENLGTRIYNNIAYDHTNSGFYIHRWGTASAYSRDAEFVNNTSCNNGVGIYINSEYVENCLIRNNIFYKNTIQIAIDSDVLTECVVDHNLYYIHNDGEPMGTDTVEGDPLFVDDDIVLPDYHLQNGSPAIGVGSLVKAPADDYDGVVRGIAIDMGAFEYV